MKKIAIPSDSLVILCGPTASGKSTFAKKHFAEWQVVSSDRCRAMIADDEKDQSVNSVAFSIFHRIIEERLHLGKLTVADSTALSDRSRMKLVQMAYHYHRPTIALLFNVSEKTCAAWNEKRERKVDERVLERHARAFDEVLVDIWWEPFARVYILQEWELDHARVVLTTRAEEREAPSAPGH